MDYVEKPAPGDLAPWVECLWSVRDVRPRASRAAERVVPDGCPELIVHLGDPFSRRVGARFRAQPRAFVAGTLTRPWVLRPGARVSTLSIRFRAGALPAALGVSLEGTADREIPLGTLVGTAVADGLVAALARARTTASRFLAAETWLRNHIAGLSGRASAAGPAVGLIRRSRGQARIDDVATALGWSRRRLQRAFARDLGIAPKVYARIVRLNAVLASLDAAERARAVDMALEAGYFDQAHLLRDFREMAGRTPRVSREADGRMARHFTEPGRLRVLLDGD